MKDIIERFKHAFGMIKFLYFDISKKKLGYCGRNVIVNNPVHLTHPENVYLYDDTSIYAGATILINTGKFIMKKHSGAAQGLTVVTGNHNTVPGSWFKDCMRAHFDTETDVVVEEDVWIGASVTLLAGSRLGRGCVVGGGSVVRHKIPPYAIVIGNPAKVVGFRFTLDEILSHEEALYAENERLSKDLLEKNYAKYFINRVDEIKKYIRL